MRWSVGAVGGGGVLPSSKGLAAEALEGLLFRVSALVALDVLEAAKAFLAVAAGQGLCLLPAAGVGVDVGCVALAGGVDAWKRHHGGGWVCRSQFGV